MPKRAGKKKAQALSARTLRRRRAEAEGALIQQAGSRAQVAREGVGNFTGAERSSYVALPKVRAKIVEAPVVKLGLFASAVLAAGARAAYNSFVREAGYAKHASIPDYDQLKEFQKARWERIARDVLDETHHVEVRLPPAEWSVWL